MRCAAGVSGRRWRRQLLRCERTGVAEAESGGDPLRYIVVIHAHSQPQRIRLTETGAVLLSTQTAENSRRRGPAMILVRQEIGEVLRDLRQQKGRTLRQVAGRASVALGYLSEVERGQKEASSEILASVAEALDVPISTIMREVGDRISVLEGLQGFPDVVPDDLVASVDAELSLR